MAVRFFGIDPTAVTDWSVAEDAVSYDRSSTDGGFSQVSISGLGDGKVLDSYGKEIIIDDSGLGRTTGVVVGAQQTASTWNVTADSAFHMLNIERTMLPAWQLTAEQVVRRFFSVAVANPAVVNTIKVYVHTSVGSRKFNVAGTGGNLWAAFKSWLSANDLNVAWVFDTIAVYANRTSTIRSTDVVSDWTVNLQQEERASTIECYVYHRKSTNGFMFVYPHYQPHVSNNFYTSDKTQTDNTILSVDSGETKTYDIKLNAELDGIRQPTHMWTNPFDYTSDIASYPNGYYQVIGKDNKPITPAQWKAEGGQLHVELTDDPSVVRVTLTGMVNERLAPYRVAASSGYEDYQGLLLAGSGQIVAVSKVSLQTGSGYSTESVVIDNPNIDSFSKAYDAMNEVAARASGSSYTLSWNGLDPVRETYTDFALGWTAKTPTLADVQAFTGQPLPEKVASKWPANTTMAKIKQDLANYMLTQISNGRTQSFGRVAGARTFFANRWWRIDSATLSSSGVSFEASQDTRLSDIMRHYGNSPGQFPIPSGGVTLGKLNFMDMRRVNA